VKIEPKQVLGALVLAALALIILLLRWKFSG